MKFIELRRHRERKRPYDLVPLFVRKAQEVDEGLYIFMCYSTLTDRILIL